MERKKTVLLCVTGGGARRYRGVQDCNTGKYAGKDRIRCESCDDTECNEFYQSAGI